jgi:hypothetical protein
MNGTKIGADASSGGALLVVPLMTRVSMETERK